VSKKKQKLSEKLENRRKGYDNVPEYKKGGYKRPGSMSKKK
jgi:hypothetical protein